MIKTPLSTVIGGAFWTPGATILGSSSKNLSQLIKSLFSLGEQGFAYDPNDLTTLYQDAAGTIPVTAAGQPVGLMKDKSGRNNHAFQTVSASRPILQRNATTGAYYLAFDGVDDSFQTATIDFTATDKVILFTGVSNIKLNVVNVLAELSASADTVSNVGSFYLAAPSVTNFRAQARGTNATVRFAAINASSFNVEPVVLSAKYDLAQRVGIKANSIEAESQGSVGGNFGNYPLFIGRRNETQYPFNGHIYSLIGIGRLTTDSETAALEKAIAKNTGVTLNA